MTAKSNPIAAFLNTSKIYLQDLVNGLYVTAVSCLLEETNNYSETNILDLKDVVFDRVKACRCLTSLSLAWNPT